MAGDELKFKNGNLCRIYIKNFLTFDEVEVRPKPKLNFICGPNGSGKSTILCAIHFCLGGKAAAMGRGKEVYNYVKIGKTEAMLEVEVFVEEETNVVITHKINQAKRQCKWYIQGKEVSNSVAERKIMKLDIHVDNLCQFLPQDKVAAFALMNCQDLLMNTEMSVGEPSLYEDHQILCRIGQNMEVHQEHMKELQAEVAQAERRNSRLKDVVKNLEIKHKLEQELKELKTQQAWYLYDHKRMIHQKHRDELSEKEKELESWKKKMTPAMQAITNKIKSYTLMKKTAHIEMDSIRKKQTTQQRLMDDVENIGEKLNDAKCAYNTKKSLEEQRQNEIEDYKRQLQVLLGQLQNLPELDQAEVTRRLRDLTDIIQKTSQEMVRLQGQSLEIGMRKDNKASILKQNMKELKNMEDLKERRLEVLKSYNTDAIRATLWLQNNLQSFKSLVYPPICVLLNIKNQRYARYVENHIAERDLVAFVCENKDDVNRLKKEMDSQNIRINIVFADPSSLSKFKPPQPITQLKRYGFDIYMLDCIEAPPAILSFLCQNYNLHTVPIANSGDYDAVPAVFKTFYMGEHRYSRTVSRYDGQVSTSIFPLGAFKLLKINQDMERISNLKARIETMQEEIKGDQETVKGLREEEGKLVKKLEGWRNEKRSLAARKEERKSLDQRIQLKKDQIKKHEMEAIDLEEAKTIMDNSIKEYLKNQAKIITRIQNLMQETGTKICQLLKMEGKVKVAGMEVKALEKNSQEWKVMMAEMEKNINEMKQVLKKHRLEGRDALQNLKKMLGINDISEITEEIRVRFQNSSLEETEKELAEKYAYLDCLATASKSEVHEYKQGLRELAKLEESLQDLKRTQETQSQDLISRKDGWLPRINSLVSNINRNFSEFMARMGYAGEVVLNEAGDNFSKYGLAIKVKFHNDQYLQRLTAQKQSGGERAVSTALYLMALQNLTAAPFRCVDEINQGMDKVNERKMLQMLMETEANEKCTQYFFVTPKLLQNLTFTSNVNVMVVLNSPTALTHRHLNIKRILKRKEEANKRLSGRFSIRV